jgi:hypothetical protein
VQSGVLLYVPSVPQEGTASEEAGDCAGTASPIGINCHEGAEGGCKGTDGEGTKEMWEASRCFIPFIVALVAMAESEGTLVNGSAGKRVSRCSCQF